MDSPLTEETMSPQLAGLVLRLQEWSRNCLIDGLKMDNGEPTLQALLREAYLTLMRSDDSSAVETSGCARCKEHEQFRHQHRDCDRMGVALQQIGMLVKGAQSPEKASQPHDKRVEGWCHTCSSYTCSAQKASCEHDWIDARNEVVASGEWCRKCGAIRAGNAQNGFGDV